MRRRPCGWGGGPGSAAHEAPERDGHRQPEDEPEDAVGDRRGDDEPVGESLRRQSARDFGMRGAGKMGDSEQHGSGALRRHLRSEQEQSHADPGAHDRERELASGELRREDPWNLGGYSDRRVREEDHEAGDAPEEALTPRRAAAPGEDRAEQEGEPDGGGDVRYGRPGDPFEPVLRRPRFSVMMIGGVGVTVLTVRGAGAGGLVFAVREGGAAVVTAFTVREDDGMAVVFVRRIPEGVRMDLPAVAVCEQARVAAPGLVRFRRLDERR